MIASAPPQVRFLTRVVTPDEYDAATRRSPAACPLFALGDTRTGRQLLRDAAADAAAPLAALPPCRLAAITRALADRAAALLQSHATTSGIAATGCGDGASRVTSTGSDSEACCSSDFKLDPECRSPAGSGPPRKMDGPGSGPFALGPASGAAFASASLTSTATDDAVSPAGRGASAVGHALSSSPPQPQPQPPPPPPATADGDGPAGGRPAGAGALERLLQRYHRVG